MLLKWEIYKRMALKKKKKKEYAQNIDFSFKNGALSKDVKRVVTKTVTF